MTGAERTSARPLRLCFVGTHAASPDRYPSGAQTVAAELLKRGHAVHLASTRRGRLARVWDIRRTVRRASRAFDVVVIDTFSTRALWYARMASRIARRQAVKSVAYLRGGDLPRVAGTAPHRLRPHLTRVDRVVAPSAYLAREVGGPLEIEVEVIPNLVPLSEQPTRTRTHASPRLLWVRAFSAEYRPKDAVRLVAELTARLDDVRLVMAGPDKDGSLGRCRALAKTLGVAERIAFPGLVSKTRLRELSDEADVFVNTTSVDNFPVSVVEAMACGLCIVSTNAGGLPDLLEDEATALLVPPGRVDALAEAVLRVVQEPGLAARLSSGAREAAQSYDVPVIVQAWEALLLDLTSEGC